MVSHRNVSELSPKRCRNREEIAHHCTQIQFKRAETPNKASWLLFERCLNMTDDQEVNKSDEMDFADSTDLKGELMSIVAISVCELKTEKRFYVLKASRALFPYKKQDRQRREQGLLVFRKKVSTTLFYNLHILQLPLENFNLSKAQPLYRISAVTPFQTLLFCLRVNRYCE